MQQKTRDNLIYLAVGLGVAALLAADFFYADSHGREMWMPSTFVFRAVASTALLVYFLAKKMRRAAATLVQVLTATLLACLVHVGMIFTFRQAVDRLPSISFCPLVILEMFFVGVFCERAVLRLTSGGDGG